MGNLSHLLRDEDVSSNQSHQSFLEGGLLEKGFRWICLYTNHRGFKVTKGNAPSSAMGADGRSITITGGHPQGSMTSPIFKLETCNSPHIKFSCDRD